MYEIEFVALTGKWQDSYHNEQGYTFAREWGTVTYPNGYQYEVNGAWVMRDPNGNYIDHDQNRHDLAERNEAILL